MPRSMTHVLYSRSKRILSVRGVSALTGVAVLGLGMLATSCGGSGGWTPKPMSLVEFLIVDRSLQSTAPTGSTSVPRNAQYRMIFNEEVLPESVDFQTIQVRTGPQFASIPGGSFRVNGNEVIYDPILDVDGTPRPFGLDPLRQFSLDIPSVEERPGVVTNLDGDPNLRPFFTTWKTSEGYLRELVPPEVVRAYFVPGADPITKNVPGGGLLALEFSEVMDPTSFNLAPFSGADSTTGVDIRYTQDPVNVANSVAGATIPGLFEADAAATTYFFVPTFSFGAQKLVFTCEVFQNLKDLSGNLLINPQSFGPWTCDGNGRETGKVLTEVFVNQTDNDLAMTDADWGIAEEGTLQGQPISSRDVLILGADFFAGADYSGDGYDGPGGTHAATPGTNITGARGQYILSDSPLCGLSRNNYTPTPNPATDLGRRIMQSYSDIEMGPAGSITAMGWGPHRNGTFAASYKDIILRFGYQRSNSMSLASSFAGNYAGSPTVVFQGDYQVTQALNIGNHNGAAGGGTIIPVSIGTGCSAAASSLQPMMDFTGFFAWPKPSTFFAWDPGTGDENDSILIFDMSVPEGDNWQGHRLAWLMKYPCAGNNLGAGSAVSGFPTRWMLAGHEEDTPNPSQCLTCPVATRNPDVAVLDTMFTITRVVSLAQSKFYGPPTAPWTAGGGETFGVKTDYLTPLLLPTFQTGGAQIALEFQGAMDVAPDRTSINMAFGSTGWVTNIDDCDGFPYIRWRATLTSNLGDEEDVESGEVAKLKQLSLPMVQLRSWTSAVVPPAEGRT